MKIARDIFILSVFILGAGVVHAQRKKKFPPSQAAQKKPIPFFKTYLGDLPPGIYHGDTLERILGYGLTAKDQFGKFYRVIYFEFGFQSSDTTLNDSTGMPQLVNDYVSYVFYAPRLDTLWLNRIAGEISSGDTLFFDHVIAEDTLHRIKYKVPSLKFGVR
ncbi:MAG TPA: hypothetical protein VNE41_11110 [Chitinophagaceae bacterium]|nr:hypothetical protein [Chitinophagaceae bacterium]